MKLNAKLIHFLTGPWLISLILSLIIWIFLPVKIEKYSLTLKSKEKRGRYQIRYFDFDRDGKSERIHLYEDFIGKVGILVYSGDRVINQWNFERQFRGGLSHNVGLTFKDLDNDGITEIIFVTFNNGNILLHCLNPINDKIVFQNKKIGTYTLTDGNNNTNVIFINNTDSNGDDPNKIYFAINSTFSIWPRGMYVYDFANDTLTKSPISCNLMNSPFGAYDIDGDGASEFYSSSDAVGNCDSNQFYTDHFSWLMVFNSDLQFKFQPVKTGIYPSNFIVQHCEFNNQMYLAGMYIYKGMKQSPNYIALYNNEGKIYKKTELGFDPASDPDAVTLLPQTSADQITILKNNGNILNLNEELKVISTLNIGPVQAQREYIILDLNNDGESEYIMLSKPGDKLIVLALDFSYVTDCKSNESISIYNISVKNDRENPAELFIQSEDFNYTFLYKRNPYFSFRFLLLPGIYLAILGGTSFLSRLQRIRLEHKYTAEKQLLELQLKSIKNQLDPHFTLNLIASIGDLFDKKDTKSSRYVFNKYSTLLRNSVLNADQLEVSLEQELEFVENYLNLEKFRMNNRFDFELSKNDLGKSVYVPKMLIHSFIENAISHGIRHLEKSGRIEIIVQMEEKDCLIRIRDNGIGRERSRQMMETGTGKGLSIVDRILMNYNDLKKTKLSYKIIDLKDGEANSLGTEVIIRIPI